jgi:hypothetical protein
MKETNTKLATVQEAEAVVKEIEVEVKSEALVEALKVVE